MSLSTARLLCLGCAQHLNFPFLFIVKNLNVFSLHIYLNFFLPFKHRYSKVTFDYLINMQYVENLEEVLFIRGVEDFCLLGGLLLLFLLFYILLHIEWGTLTRTSFWSVRKPDIFLTLEKKLSLQFLIWVVFNC